MQKWNSNGSKKLVRKFGRSQFEKSGAENGNHEKVTDGNKHNEKHESKLIEKNATSQFIDISQEISIGDLEKPHEEVDENTDDKLKQAVMEVLDVLHQKDTGNKSDNVLFKDFKTLIQI